MTAHGLWHEPFASVAKTDDNGGAAVEAATDRTPLMLIHGAWLSARSWANFAEYFGSRGFNVAAPEWPRKEGDVAELRENAGELEGLGLTEIVDHYESAIRALDQPPVLIGHSFGGLIVTRPT
jgi:non-heme chloroperoxidase